MKPSERLIVAIDSTERDDILRLSDAVAENVGRIKLGPIAFAAHGPALVREVAQRRPVFLDLKLHDIPNTVAGAIAPIAALEVDLVTLHAAGGRAMIAAAAEAAAAAPRPPRLLAVTVLTSLDADGLAATGCARSLEEQVAGLAALAVAAGADGVVCSPHEVAVLRKLLGDGPLLVVPGIRPAGADRGDQRRTATAAEAIAAGADYLVVGRPITRAEDPGQAAREIVDQIAAARA